MSSILRQIVASPRIQHPETGLDLCYVTNNSIPPCPPAFLTTSQPGPLTSDILLVIATSSPSGTYPQRAYRNPLDALVSFLDSKHGENWCIWEFRAEGTGYPDSEVYNRIHHFPWPDHNPPPFALIPNIMESMRNWLQGSGNKHTKQAEKRVAVVHCKAGKGRSGTIAAAYLVSQEGWTREDALRRFTERRMRVGFGSGVSIPSQLRYVGYVDRWASQFGREYVERPVEVLEVHIWGLRDGVKVAVEGFEDEGKKIKCFHMFHRSERILVAEGNASPKENGLTDVGTESPLGKTIPSSATWTPSHSETSSSTSASSSPTASDVKRRATTSSDRNLSAVIFRPSKPVIIPGSDVNIDFERRSKASYTGFAMVTSVAHVWFNAYFEGGHEHDSGVFETVWDGMDGVKGTTKKGIRALERLKVVWRYAPSAGAPAKAKGEIRPKAGRRISQPKPGETVHECVPADWRGKQGQNQQENQIPGLVMDQEDEARTASDGASSSAQNRSGKSARDAKDTLTSAGSESLHGLGKSLGLREQTVESKDASLAGSEDETMSTTDDEGRARKDENGDFEGVRPYLADNGNGNDNDNQNAP